MQCIVEAIEVVEQPDRCQQFNDLAFVIILAQLVPERVIDCVGIAGRAFGQFYGGFFSVGEIGAVAKIRQIVDLFLAPSMPPCQGGVRGKSILAAVKL